MIERAGQTRRKGQTEQDRIREIRDEPGWTDGKSDSAAKKPKPKLTPARA